jgi:crossover junction endodeoxyribonuclease RuvC
LILLGLDPGLRLTGWGVVRAEGNHLTHIADGVVAVSSADDLARRLANLHSQLLSLVQKFNPHEAAVEETFVNKNPKSTLKLGQARGVVMSVPALVGMPVFEYSANKVKQALVGSGHASKEQVQAMVCTLLPGLKIEKADAADALAVAICHAHHRQTATRIGRRLKR